MSARKGVNPLTKEEVCLQAKPHGELKKHGSSELDFDTATSVSEVESSKDDVDS